MSLTSFRGAVEWALMVALAFGTGAVAQAQDEDADSGGPVIQIGQSDAGDETLDTQHATGGAIAEHPATPKYWIGLVGGPIGPEHPLRAHIDLPEGQGLLVVNVVPESPAEKAGLKNNDILLRANDIELHEMGDLVGLVAAEGDKGGQITLDVLRHGQHETVNITPEERPANAPQVPGGFGRALEPGFGLPEGVQIPQSLLREFGNMPLEFRQFGPGVIVGGGEGVANLPNGVSVSISKQDGQPARITVQRGGESWEVVGDDPGSLKQLPEDLQPFVEQMLKGQGSGLNFPRPGHAGGEFGDGRIRERLERMERRMQELQERLLGADGAPAQAPVETPHDSGNETK